MKKINYKKEYLREFNLRCDYSEKMDKYRRKWLFWQPLGIIAILGIIVLIMAVLNSFCNSSNWCSFNHPAYTIYENQCDNISTSKDCECLERVTWNGVEFNCNKINESSCIYYYVPVCNKVEVDKITWISQDCLSHTPRIADLGSCVFFEDKKDLNEGWLFHHGECIEYNCDGKECKKGDCHIYKIGSFEVKVE